MSGTTTHNEVRKALKRAVFNLSKLEYKEKPLAKVKRGANIPSMGVCFNSAVGYPFAKQKRRGFLVPILDEVFFIYVY